MNSDDFEAQLSRRPVPQLPAEWRAQILSAAESARKEQSRCDATEIESRTSGHLRWGALATVWLAIGLISTFDPSSESSSPVATATVTPSQFEHRWQERLRLLAELADPPPSPPPTPMPRRRSGFHPVHLKTFA